MKAQDIALKQFRFLPLLLRDILNRHLDGNLHLKDLMHTILLLVLWLMLVAGNISAIYANGTGMTAVNRTGACAAGPVFAYPPAGGLSIVF